MWHIRKNQLSHIKSYSILKIFTNLELHLKINTCHQFIHQQNRMADNNLEVGQGGVGKASTLAWGVFMSIIQYQKIHIYIKISYAIFQMQMTHPMNFFRWGKRFHILSIKRCLTKCFDFEHQNIQIVIMLYQREIVS